MLTKNGYLIVD